MSVFTTQGYKFRLVAGSGSYADRTQLDLFADEEIKVSNNVTELFDIGAVPGTFTRTITLPGTKRNNAFFEQYYDISVYEPDIFNTNQKIEAYLDFDGIYLVTGYLQLSKVSVYENKFVDSYEVNIFGIVSNFTIDANSLFLTDLDNLSIYNHTSSLENVSSSMSPTGLFNGEIRYALTDSGTGIYYALDKNFQGIDDNEGALTVQQFKPAIKVKTVWDAVFQKLGYTYTSSFFNQPLFDNMYMILNNNFKYPVYPNIELENLAVSKVTTITGSFQNITLPASTKVGFPANSKAYDYTNVMTLGSPLTITIPKRSYLTARINLVFSVSGSTSPAGSGMPAFYLHYTGSGYSDTQALANINGYLTNIQQSRTQTTNETFELASDFKIPPLPANVPIQIFIEQIPFGVNNFTVKLNPLDSNVGSTLEIRALNQGADFEILDVPFNMPFGTSGIKLIDFIRGVQKKFNLVMYESNTIPNQFIIETFNTWYKQGQYQDFNQYINLNEKIEFIPATSLAVNTLDFTDTQDTDYVSTLWQRTYNRTYGQAVLIATSSYFSQGTFAVKNTLASGPLTLVPGSVFTGSYNTQTQCTSYLVTNESVSSGQFSYQECSTGTPTTVQLSAFDSTTVCSRVSPYDYTSEIVIIDQGDCSPSTPAVTSGSQFGMFIPYYISNDATNPSARVMPRLFFYNGQLPATKYYIEGYYLTSSFISQDAYTNYPYFDNYSVVTGSSLPSSGSYSLLYNNETPSLGSIPTASLIDTYWSTYLNLLYNPRTRLVNAAAVIPLADYFNMELNDLVQFRSNYYHLRAINDYNLTTGECAIQLLGPTIPNTVSSILFPSKYEIELLLVGGGGGGGYGSSAQGPGGGGGNALTASYEVYVDDQYQVVVGAGGSGGIWDVSSSVVESTRGGNSTFGPLIVNQPVGYGGGAAGGYATPTTQPLKSYGSPNQEGVPTGNGAGGNGRGADTGTIMSGSGPSIPPPPYGPLGTYRGAPRVLYVTSSGGTQLNQDVFGGGGGAGETGVTGSFVLYNVVDGIPCQFWNGGRGGNGIVYNTYSSSYFGGGGGAGGLMIWAYQGGALVPGFYSSSQNNPGSGSLGGGGNGGAYFVSQSSITRLPESGSTNSGGGGGGGTAFLAIESLRQSGSNYYSGAPGGSGIVILRYQGSQKGNGGIISTSGSYTYHTFISGGYYTA